MRATIQITSKQRARLLELAARRGERDFSRLVQEALDQYLAAHGKEGAARARALTLRGALERCEAEALRKVARDLRSSRR